MKRCLNILSAALGIAFAGIAGAAALSCEACSEAEVEQLARYSGLDPVYVYDLPNGGLRYFRVHDSERPAAPDLVEIPVPDYVAEYWQALSTLYATAASVDMEVTLEAEVIGMAHYDAYKLVAASYARNDVKAAIRSNPEELSRRLPQGAWEAFEQARSYGLNLGLNLHTPRLTINVNFDDGSRASFHLTPGQSQIDPDFVPHSAYDGAGNPIPDANDARFARRYDFSSNETDRDRWELALQRYSIPLTEERSLVAKCDWSVDTLICSYVN